MKKTDAVLPSAVFNLRAAKTNEKIFVVTVKSTDTSGALFQYFKKTGAAWMEVLRTDAFVGEYGIGSTKEGDRKTPTGLYHFSMLMGIAPDPGTRMPYHQIGPRDYWCGGEKYYNRFIDESVQEHDCPKDRDEHLIDYPRQYQYAAVLDFNADCVYDRGSAIFLHCKGEHPYTGGCIAVDAPLMKDLIREIDEKTAILIDLKDQINRAYY